MVSSPRANPRSIPTHILQPRKISETKTMVDPMKHALSETKQMIRKILNLNGKLVEPRTPPGPPPYLKSSIRRPMIKQLTKKI